MSPRTTPKRLVLFDIDGTLLFGGPLWKESFLYAVAHYFPKLQVPRISFNGKTDLQIAREMIMHCGFSQEEVEDYMHQIVALYVSNARAQIGSRRHEVQVLPGVCEVLRKLDENSDVLLGLLTGNVQEGARAKLEAAGLERYFKFGVYGDDHWDRYLLPELAVRRVQEKFGHVFSGKQIVIIGDTVHDVNCGKSIGVRSIAVGTGRNVSKEELLAQAPDYYFNDLSGTAEVMQAILEEIA